MDGTRDRIIEELKQVFNDYNGMTSSMKSSLKAMGLEVVEDGNHNHLRFIDDNRYKVAFAKTPSDRRVGLISFEISRQRSSRNITIQSSRPLSRRLIVALCARRKYENSEGSKNGFRRSNKACFRSLC